MSDRTLDVTYRRDKVANNCDTDDLDWKYSGIPDSNSIDQTECKERKRGRKSKKNYL